MPTSDPLAAEHNSRRTWWFVYGTWAILSLISLLFIIRYAQPGPIIDEWEFIPALSDEEPFWPWLWKLHNEHRFPLPRLLWYPLTKITGNYAVGCYVSLLGVSLLTLLMIRLAEQLRGRLHYADMFFPLSLLHLGHWENLRMGYQIVFMMNLVFAGLLLWIILKTNRQNLARRGLQAGVVTLLLLGCGAGGLAFGPFMAVWLVTLALWIWRFETRPEARHRAWWIIELTVAIPIYIWLYFENYSRPSHHADPIVIWETHTRAAWQALRSGAQALSMAFGPAVTGLWPITPFLLAVLMLACLILLIKVFIHRVDDRPRILGLLLYFGAVVLMALGIGWGRCTFLTKEGEPGFMGHSSRYCWITWPALGATYYLWLLYGTPRQAKWATIALCGIMVAMLPFNQGTGIMEGEAHRQHNAAWEKSVREGKSDGWLIQEYYPNYYGELKDRMRVGLHLLRKNHIQYYRPLPEFPVPVREGPPQ